jgi:hypothetical protein
MPDQAAIDAAVESALSVLAERDLIPRYAVQTSLSPSPQSALKRQNGPASPTAPKIASASATLRPR